MRITYVCRGSGVGWVDSVLVCLWVGSAACALRRRRCTHAHTTNSVFHHDKPNSKRLSGATLRGEGIVVDWPAEGGDEVRRVERRGRLVFLFACFTHLCSTRVTQQDGDEEDEEGEEDRGVIYSDTRMRGLLNGRYWRRYHARGRPIPADKAPTNVCRFGTGCRNKDGKRRLLHPGQPGYVFPELIEVGRRRWMLCVRVRACVPVCLCVRACGAGWVTHVGVPAPPTMPHNPHTYTPHIHTQCSFACGGEHPNCRFNHDRWTGKNSVRYPPGYSSAQCVCLVLRLWPLSRGCTGGLM